MFILSHNLAFEYEFIIEKNNMYFFYYMEDAKPNIEPAKPNTLDPEKTKLLIAFLNKGLIPCTALTDLNGMLLPRELFFNDLLYKQLKEIIPDLKQLFSSSYLTALQAPAEDVQKWPQLNLMRQVLRSCHFKLTPKRISDGYTLDGKKKYKRMFIIEKMRVI
jgi:hypothetical protein